MAFCPPSPRLAVMVIVRTPYPRDSSDSTDDLSSSGCAPTVMKLATDLSGTSLSHNWTMPRFMCCSVMRASCACTRLAMKSVEMSRKKLALAFIRTSGTIPRIGRRVGTHRQSYPPRFRVWGSLGGTTKVGRRLRRRHDYRKWGKGNGRWYVRSARLRSGRQSTGPQADLRQAQSPSQHGRVRPAAVVVDDGPAQLLGRSGVERAWRGT